MSFATKHSVCEETLYYTHFREKFQLDNLGYNTDKEIIYHIVLGTSSIRSTCRWCKWLTHKRHWEGPEWRDSDKHQVWGQEGQLQVLGSLMENHPREEDWKLCMLIRNIKTWSLSALDKRVLITFTRQTSIICYQSPFYLRLLGR